MMKNILLFLGTFLGCGFAQAADYVAGAFVPGFEDVPLMQGLSESKDSVASFDAPEARFIQVYLAADKNLTRDKIKKFYTEALPPLGWKPSLSAKNLCFTREDEVLCLETVGELHNLLVKFELNTVLTPAP